MEQKKILWILLSVTLFLFIISIAGVVWFYPGRILVAEEDASSDNQGRAALDMDPVEVLRNEEGVPLFIDSPEDVEEGFSIVYGETDEMDPVMDLSVDTEIEKVIEDTTSPVEKTPVVIQEPVKTIITSTAVVTEPRKINVLEYWIQAGSFSSRSRAESSSQSLSEKGFSNLITIKTVDDNDFYRVRMGPYLSKAEAEKFLLWVKDIDSYEKSYISQVYVQKTVN